MSTVPYGVDPAAPASSALPPPAPPLPPQRYGHRAANALARFAQPFIHGSRPPSASGDRPSDLRSSRLRPMTFSSLASETTTHKTGIPIAALDKSPYGTHAILAGRDILKTIQVSGASCAEEFNLRSHIIAYAAAHKNSGEALSGRYKDQLAANDVKWSHGRYDTTIATAAANGQIVIYDLNRPGVELARLHEHNRQVHRISFNPHQGALLLSGSQDATVRLWDMREPGGDKCVISGRSVDKYSLNSEGIRDLQWSPTNGVEFAAGTDSGVIQRWDFRRNNFPVLKINAHEKTCHSIDWHPDGKHLASGGADKNIRIWDFSSTDRRMKVAWQIRAPQAVLNVRWRPACSNAIGQSPGNWECTQLAASYDQLDPQLHVWDLRRPYLPFRQLGRYDTPPAALLWHSERLLWSVGAAGMFTQTDVSCASQVLDERSPNVVAIAPTGQINLFSERRLRRRNALENVSNDFAVGRKEQGGSDERLSTSHVTHHSSHEEASPLSSSYKARQWKAANARSSKTLASTPPSIGPAGPMLKLDESLQKEILRHSAQAGASGHVLGVFDVSGFKFLACNYKMPVLAPKADMQWDLHESMSETFEYNASLAACVGHHRLAHTWTILSMVVRKELKLRAENNSALRRKGMITFTSLANPPYSQSMHRNRSQGVHGQQTDHGPSDDVGPCGMLKSSIYQENESNLTTPLARPMPDPPHNGDENQSSALKDESDAFKLPVPALAQQIPNQQHPKSDRTRLESVTNGTSATTYQQTSRSSSEKEGRDSPHEASSISPVDAFVNLELQMSERRAAMSNYRAQPRPPLRLDDPFYAQGEGLLAPSLGRQDSDESFQVFPGSTESSQRAASIGGSFGSSRDSNSTPERSKSRTRTGSEDHLELGSSDLIFGSHESYPPPLDIPYLPHRFRDVSTLTTAGIPPAAPSPLLVHRPNQEPPVIHLNDINTPKDLASLSSDLSSLPYFIPSDYSRPTVEVPFKPWDMGSLVSALAAYHINTLLDSQTSTFLLLYLLPYFTITLSPSLVASVLVSYHNQLNSLSLYVQAAELRNLTYPTYQEVYECGAYGIVSGGPWCSSCQKPSKGGKEGHCTRCRQRWGPCPICNDEGPLPFPCSIPIHESTKNPNVSRLWGWCQICAHGGHLGCLRTWWSDLQTSEGGCATLGCLHDCVAGTRRDENFRRAAEEKKASAVKGDEWVVGESAAVEKARDLVGIKGEKSEKRKGEGRGPLSAGLGGRSVSGGKKVRLVVPGADTEGESHLIEGRTSASVP